MLCKADFGNRMNRMMKSMVRGKKREVNKRQPTHFVTSDGGGGNCTWLSTRKSPQYANFQKDKFAYNLRGKKKHTHMEAPHCSRDIPGS